jgi:hypothetical protein
MARISIELAEPASVFGVHFPRTGVVVRDIPSSKQRDWRLIRLDAKLHYQGKANDWLLIRAEDAPTPGTQSAPVEVLLVGEIPQVADGFDEGNFARVGEALTSPVFLNLSRWQKFWIRFALIVIVLVGAGWYAWNYDPDIWFGKFVARLLFLIPELIK